MLLVSALAYAVLCLTPLWATIPGLSAAVAVDQSQRAALPFDHASFWALVIVVLLGTLLQLRQGAGRIRRRRPVRSSARLGDQAA